MSLDKLDQLVEALRLPAGARVLDIASGKAELLRRIAARYSASGTGVERNAHFCEEARTAAEARGLASQVTVLEMDGRAFEASDASFDVAMCIGGEWIFDGFKGTLAALARWTRPGGMVVAGTPFWTSPPPAAYLDAMGFNADSFSTHAGNVRTGEAQGLTLAFTIASSQDDWDRYTSLSWLAAYDYMRDHPDDPDNAEIEALTAKDKAAYLGYGRDCLSWGIYLFRRP